MAQLVSALDWVTQNHADADTLNISIASGAVFPNACDDQETWNMALLNAVSVLRSTGTALFAATGNAKDKDNLSSPACLTPVIAVGAVYDDDVELVSLMACKDPSTAPDQVGCYSNSSPMLDLYAPGSIITAAWLGGATQGLHRTSMAAPHACASAALLREVNPKLTVGQIESLLKDTGKMVLGELAVPGFERPRIDVKNAVERLLADSSGETTDLGSSTESDKSSHSDESTITESTSSEDSDATTTETSDEDSNETSTPSVDNESEASSGDDAADDDAEGDDDDDDTDNDDQNAEDVGCGCAAHALNARNVSSIIFALMMGLHLRGRRARRPKESLAVARRGRIDTTAIAPAKENQ